MVQSQLIYVSLLPSTSLPDRGRTHGSIPEFLDRLNEFFTRHPVLGDYSTQGFVASVAPTPPFGFGGLDAVSSQTDCTVAMPDEDSVTFLSAPVLHAQAFALLGRCEREHTVEIRRTGVTCYLLIVTYGPFQSLCHVVSGTEDIARQ